MYKILYFKIHQREPAELEIGIAPEEDNVTIDPDSSSKRNDAIIRVPPSVRVMKFKAGDPWPLSVPNLKFYSWDLAKQFGSVKNIKAHVMLPEEDDVDVLPNT